MLLAEVTYGQKWYPLQLPSEIQKEIYDFFDLSEDDEMEGWMLYRGDCPLLDKWMHKHSYLQDIVSVSHYPEVMDKEGPSKELIEKAKALWYDVGNRVPSCLPLWDTLSPTTKAVWIERAKETA